VTADEIREHARQLVATLPPISQTQLNQLRLILRSVASADRPARTAKAREARRAA
jgi:hypothetical protein